MRATKAIIHIDYFKENIRNIRRFTASGVKMCVPVKADAYGHGAVECAKAALDCGVDYLAVATVDEGVELRNAGIDAPILLFSLCSPEEIHDAVSHDITPFVFDRDYIRMVDDEAGRLGKKKFPVHLAVDTGMGRIGCMPSEAADLASFVCGSENLFLEGTMTHFATSDCKDPDSIEYTKLQFKRFTDAIESIRARGLNPGICHCANSAATLDLPKTHLDMVRPGIIVYGYDAGDVNSDYLSKKGTPIDLKPVMTLETEVSAVRHFSKGSSVGYGRTWTADKDTDIAVLTIGYGDGFVRRFSSAGIKVSINGKEYPVRGRICMDQCMVDLGLGSDVKRWDRAVIFGSKADGAMQTAEDIARMTGTISYEITTVLTRRVPRKYVGI
ncbi:MAG: alanine racemase [Treponema sp.]|nr:alanine racemase [Treponema sp.]